MHTRRAIPAIVVLAVLSEPAAAHHRPGHGGGGGGGGDGGDPQPDPAFVYLKNNHLWVMNEDGSGPAQTLSNAGWWPAWSPDAAQIVFRGGDGVGGAGIYTVNADGTALSLVRAFIDSGGTGVAWSPAPAPDGQHKIVYPDEPVPSFGPRDIFLVNPDGTGLVNLTNTPARSESGPTWNATGDRIAVHVSTVGLYNNDLIVYDIAWTESGPVITGETSLIIGTGSPLQGAGVTMPDWARTQDKIAVQTTTASSGYDIWIIDLSDPVNPVNLTQTPGLREHHPTWSPDDSRIAYTRQGNGAKVFITARNADGTGSPQDLYGGSGVASPDWRRTMPSAATAAGPIASGAAPLRHDLDGNGRVDVEDLLAWLMAVARGDALADVDRDDRVDELDLAVVLANVVGR